MTQERVLIDPFSFFSSAGPVAVEVVKPPPPVAPTRPASALRPAVSTSPVAKRVRVEPVCSDERPARMPGVMASRADSVAVPHMVSELWVEKYKPRKISELVGNRSSVDRLVSWLRSYGSAEKAVLISGPPGIGKTSTARLVCESLGYVVLEFNASDTRSKQAIDELASGLSTNKVLFAGAAAGNGVIGSKVAIVMDEVDGMAGGDRGGAGALIQMIKKSKLPVVCICNDRQDTKVRSLANHCVDLRFVKPTPGEIAARALVVVKGEGMEKLVAERDLMGIAEASSCDMRQVINQLQLIRTSGAAVVSDKQKDEALGPFEVVKGLFTSATARGWDYAKRNELFFIDYDFTPLLIQQNYAKCVEKVTDPRVLPALRKAGEYIALGDVISRAIHQDSVWSLLPEYATISTVAPAFACNNALPFPDFPAWLGKQSTTGKNQRLLRELRTMVGTSSTCTSRNMKLSGYADVLYNTIVGKLVSGSMSEAIAILDELGVTKDALFSVLTEVRFNWQPDPYGQLDSKSKAAFTRTYNSGSHVLKAGCSGDSAGASKRAAAGAMAAPARRNELAEGDDNADDGQGDSPNGDEDDSFNSNLVKPKSQPKSTAARKGKAGRN